MEFLFNMTIAGTATAIIILLVKLVFKDRLTPKWHFYIWIILVLRLLVPGLPDSDASLLNVMPTVQNVATVEGQPEGAKGGGETYVEGEFALKTPINRLAGEQEFQITKQKMDILLVVWISGMILMASYITGAYTIFSRRTNRLPICNDKDILGLLENCKKAVDIKKPINLRMGGDTPMLKGLLKPIIIIPQGYTNEELKQVLTHELCHYRHKDILTNIISCIILCFYWFNPVMWASFYVVRRDIEMLCDQRVIEITGERKEYAAVLLKTALRRNQFVFATTSMQNGEKEVVKRIKYIACFKKPKIWISILAIVLAVIVGILCLTDATESKNNVIYDAGGDGNYFFKISEGWAETAVDNVHDGTVSYLGYTLFYDKGGKNFAGIDTVKIPLPSFPNVNKRSQLDNMPFTSVLINLDYKKENQNHIVIWPEKNSSQVYDLWADSDEVTEKELIEVAKTFTENPCVEGYKPEVEFTKKWSETADFLLNDYFKNYEDAEMTRATDISGYNINKIEKVDDDKASWSIIYPDAAVFKVDYTLDIAYPEKYTFAGGGFEIGKENKTKIFKDELAIFNLDKRTDKATFLGFILTSDRAETGDDAKAALYTIEYNTLEFRAKELLQKKTKYIGDNSKVGRIIGSLPLTNYCTGMELQTKEEPYEVIANYDLREFGSLIFESSGTRPASDSRGWEINMYLKSTLYQNAATLLSLIDNAGKVRFNVTGISDTGVPYTFSYLLDRKTLDSEAIQDPRLSPENTESVESYMEFLSALSDSQAFPYLDMPY